MVSPVCQISNSILNLSNILKVVLDGLKSLHSDPLAKSLKLPTKSAGALLPWKDFYGFELFCLLVPIKMQKSRQVILAQATGQVIDVECPAAIDWLHRKVGSGLWPEVYDLCHTFLHLALVRKHTDMRELHAKCVQWSWLLDAACEDTAALVQLIMDRQ